MDNLYPKNFKDLIKPIKKELTIIVLLSAFGTLSLLIAPISVAIALHSYLSLDMNNFLIWIVIGAMGLAFKQILHVGSVGYAHIVEANFRYKLRKDFTDKLSRLPLGFFSDTSSGAIRKFVSEDTVKIHTIIAHAFSEMTSGITLPIFCAITMIAFEWRTALIIIAIIFVIVFIGMMAMSFNSKGMEDINSTYEKAQRQMSHSAIEMVDGIKEIKNFGMEGSLFKRFDNALAEFSDVSFKWLGASSKALSFVMSAIQPTVMLFVSIVVCIFAIKMDWLLPEYTIIFILLSISLPSSIMDTMQLGNLIRDGKHSIDNLIKLYDKDDQKFKQNCDEFKLGDIRFKDVSFSYDNENIVLKDINCEFKKGSFNALVGSSGSGKTTMARLIARFWDTSSGEVTIGNVNVKDLSEKDMLSNISLVFQDVSIMNATIADNIALSQKGATREEIISAAKSACIHDRIVKLPNGYDCVYGEENVILSGGEKQRITIARAFLADAPIVLLDEATAQADAQSEQQIQKALSELSKDKTVIMIAHRLASIVNADNILVFDNGQIIQSGTHDELSKVDGMYRNMWFAQNDMEV